MYEWPQDFEDGETRAVCSKCGVPYRYPSELVLQNDGFFYCKRRCLEQTVLTRDRIQAQSRKRREQPPPKRVQPPQYADDYLGAESQFLRFILASAPAPFPGGTTISSSALSAAPYLADLILQNRRPIGWIEAAKAKLRVCADYLLTQQYGAPGGISPSTADTDIRYGAFYDGSITMSAGTTAQGGLALVKAYQALGDPKYLIGADRAAMGIRGCQCSDLFVTNGSIYPAGGSPYHTGGITLFFSFTTGLVTFGAQVIQVAATAYRFIRLLGLIHGTGQTYGVASSAYFTASTVATIATMKSELLAFMTVGAVDDSAGGVVVAPFVPVAPKNFYSPYLSGGGGTGSWVSATDTVLQMMFVIQAFHEDSVAVAETAAFYTWAMTFTSNPNNQIATGANTIGNNLGTFDPNITMANRTIIAFTRESTGALYDWRWLGCVAAFQSANYPEQFTRAKNLLGVPQPTTDGVPNLTYIAPGGISGLSFQPSTSPIVYYAQVGDCYRSSPGSYGDQWSNP